ncbi:MAG: CehA/McbA family metallohydrolase, partial [Deltaproteobacteria bacterium]|nr:CehA/McbA family metallohydrolase [Deltaproteobacteria bacterium]
MRSHLVISLALFLAAAAGCTDPASGSDAGASDAETSADAGLDAGKIPIERCAIPLERFMTRGPGTTLAKRVEGPTELIGGPNAWGKVGDYLLANDKIRVVVQARDRHIGPNPYGATIIDADLVRSGPGQDQFGEVGLFYNLARTIDPDFMEVISAGGEGEPAIVAMSGHDTAQNYLRIRNIFNVSSLDLSKGLPFKITNYFLLSPGEQRVRYVTAFCNEGTEDITTLAGDLVDPGWTVELFNGQSCTGGFGFGGMCQGIDRMSWFGYQGDGVAYGYAPYQADSPYIPESTNAVMTIAGVTGTLIGVNGLSGVSAWFGPDAAARPGALRVPAGQARAIARDFVVGRELGEVASLIETWRGAITGTQLGAFSGTVTRGGQPLAGARVSLQREGTISAVFVTDAQGRYSGRLAVGSYIASAWAPGSPASATALLQVLSNDETHADFDLVPPRRLTVTVRDAAGGSPLPAKVTVVCATSSCPAPGTTLIHFADTLRDPIPDNVQLIDFVPTSGSATFELPPAEYRVLVSRGPEWSIHPLDFPTSPGVLVDLRTADASVEAALAHVVDSSGWASADFHVHGVNSPDSHLIATQRTLSFAAEGVDVMVATDHDYVTDYGPAIREIGAEKLLASIPGEEVSPTDFGHTNTYPLSPDPDDPITRGAIDWGGGRGATLSTAEIFAEARRKGATSIQINHPRSANLGVLSALRVDLDTLATHAGPELFDMAPQPSATPDDTRLIAPDFNAYEVLNSATDDFDPYRAHACFNDWFTLISRGLKVAAIGASDTHQRFAAAAGYWRTWVRVADDAPQRITAAVVSAAVNAQKASVSNGPFVQVRVARAGADGRPTGPSAGIGEVVPASSDGLLVTVDIQAPLYMNLTRVELYQHLPADDSSCPIDPQSPEAQTTRVSCNGEGNANWPSSSIALSHAITLEPTDRELALQSGATSYWRWHKKVELRLPAPATDNWVVAMVYGTSPLFPLVYPNKLSNGGAKPVVPFALTNPVFVDADGGGYDKPPFDPPARRSPLPPPPPRGPTRD